MNPSLKALGDRILADSTSLKLKHHGPKHWINVATWASTLAEKEGQDQVFCQIFGMLHDCQRLDDYEDRQHGARAAEYAKMIRHMIPMSAAKFKRLLYALRWHDQKTFTKDKLIGCCWDADRLDLPRVGVVTNPWFLNTDTAKAIAIQRIRSM